MSITITNIGSQDKNRSEVFDIKKEISLDDALITEITAFSLVSGPGTGTDSVTITLEVDDTAASFPQAVTASSVVKMRLIGKYDHAFTDDVVKHVPAGLSAKTKVENLVERELTAEEFVIEQQNFPSIVVPTFANNIMDLPENVELIKATQGSTAEVDVNYTVSITYTLSGSSVTESKSFTHTVLNGQDVFPQLIGRAAAQRVQVADNLGALAYQKSKLLGNINTAQMSEIQSTQPFVTELNSANYADLWNTALAGNLCKWQPVEKNQGIFDFSGADILHAQCKMNGIKMLWHTLIWGADQGTPDWWEGLSESASKAAFEAWCSAIATRYGDDIYGIQTLNEIATGHQDAGTTRLINQLGGAGTSGYDWAIYIFETARHYFPNAKLWINDFGMMSNQTVRNENCAVANAIKNHNPNLIDAMGMQSHYFNINDLTAAQITAAIDDVHAQTGLPIHITELDISGTNSDSIDIDTKQSDRYQVIFPALWNHPNVERITLWGYINTENWRYDQGHQTGLINRDGTGERPALTWLKGFMETAT
tara:strand:- start:5591 stop:7204 length:1614 start_codon:yes stop_codon:yes gene_type:complete